MQLRNDEVMETSRINQKELIRIQKAVDNTGEIYLDNYVLFTYYNIYNWLHISPPHCGSLPKNDPPCRGGHIAGPSSKIHLAEPNFLQ